MAFDKCLSIAEILTHIKNALEYFIEAATTKRLCHLKSKRPSGKKEGRSREEKKKRNIIKVIFLLRFDQKKKR